MYYSVSYHTESSAMDPKDAEKLRAEGELDDMSLDDVRLSELDAESLLGHHVELEELDDWRAIDL